MSIVLILDQRRSSSNPDQVGPFSGELNAAFGPQLLRPFVRTAGDEMQALLGDGAALASILPLAAGGWWIGVGVGAIDRIGATTRESSGPAFKAARRAIEVAKRDRLISVRGEPAAAVMTLQATLAALTYIVERRTPRQREVVRTAHRSATRREAAQKLGITHQAVSDALRAAGFVPEQLLAELISTIATELVDD